MRLRKFIELLKQSGFRYLRVGRGDHEIWTDASGNLFSFPIHPTIPNGIVWQFKRRYGR